MAYFLFKYNIVFLFSAEPDDESFACKNCGKMYSNPASLIGHLKYKCNTGLTKVFLVL